MTLTNAQLAAVIADTLHGDLAAIAAALTPVTAAAAVPGQTKGAWQPVLGGSGGESGQAYTSQHGRWVKDGVLLHLFTSIQLNGKGVILGTLQLKHLPIPTATQPVFYGGICTYSSNLSPNAARVTGISLQCGGVRDSVDLYGFLPGENRRPLVPDDINDHTQMDFTMTFEVDE
jgi:hypothetical protein